MKIGLVRRVTFLENCFCFIKKSCSNCSSCPNSTLEEMFNSKDPFKMKKQDKKQAALVDDNEFTGSKTRKHENLSSKNGKKGLIFTTLVGV